MSPRPTHSSNQNRDLVQALDDIDAAIADNINRGREIRERVAWFRERLLAGASAHELTLAEASPRTVEMLTANSSVLDMSGAAFRARLAQALRHDGLTIEAIASLFGVTRQRISALLRQHADT